MEDAIRLAREAIRLGAEVHNPTIQLVSGCTLTVACLQRGDVPRAQAAIDDARRHVEPMYRHLADVLAGIVALRLGHAATATKAFQEALKETARLMDLCATNYSALDSEALAYAGLALCGDRSQLASAVKALQAARAINSNAGTVRRTRLILATLAAADATGVLADLSAASG